MNSTGFSDHASRLIDEQDDARNRCAVITAIMASNMPETEKVLAIALITKEADYS